MLCLPSFLIIAEGLRIAALVRDGTYQAHAVMGIPDPAAVPGLPYPVPVPVIGILRHAVVEIIPAPSHGHEFLL